MVYDPTRNAPRTETYTIPHGDRGIMATVRRMRELVHQGLTQPLPVETAGAIHKAYCCDAERAQAIRDMLAAGVAFTPDPVGHELLRSPSYMLERIQLDGSVNGDCDDVAILGACLGMAIGLRARFQLIGFNPTGPFSHVYTELLTTQGWVELDTTAPAQFPEGLTVARTRTVEV